MVQTLKEFIDYCLAIDQGLHQIKARAERLRARNPLNQAISNTKTGHSTPVQSVTPAAQARQPIVNPAASRAATPAASPANARPTY